MGALGLQKEPGAGCVYHMPGLQAPDADTQKCGNGTGRVGQWEVNEMAYQEITHCGKCGAAIRYIRMKRSGRWMPVDAEPVEVTPCIGLDRGGHVFITLEGETVRARKKKEAWGSSRGRESPI